MLPNVDPAVRPARAADETGLRALDAAAWSLTNSPAPAPSGEAAFLPPAAAADEVLVATIDDALVGYVKLGPDIPLDSHRHVLLVKGLAVAPDRQRQGIGGRLIDAAIERARARGARKLSLRVFATNPGAQRLYAARGFVVEGILRGEFLRGDAYVDDVLMALDLSAR